MSYLTLLHHLAVTKIEPGNLPKTTADQDHIVTIINIVLTIIGSLALLMITISGFRYITAAGNEQKIASAKNGIIYALVGLAVAIMAEAIVYFVVNRISA